MKKIFLLAIVFIFVLLGAFFVYATNFSDGKRQIQLSKSDDGEEDDSEMAENHLENDIQPEEIGHFEVESESVDTDRNDDNGKNSENVSGLSGISNKLVSWGYSQSKSRFIDTVVLHSSYNALGGNEYDLEKLISEYKNYGVSPHYLIDRKGNVYRLVKDEDIAYHAGESKTPDGRTNVNIFSIGIEIMNTKTDRPTAEQYSALKKLISGLKSEYKIKYVVGHDDIAPGRKDDPWNFDWKKIE